MKQNIIAKTLFYGCGVFSNNGVFCPGCKNSLVSSVHGGKIVWCFLSTVAKNVVSFVHPGRNSLVSFGSGVFCPTFTKPGYK